MKNIINIPDSVSLLSSDRKSEYSFIEIRIFAEEPYWFFRKFTFFQKSYSGSVDIYWLYTITFFDIRDFAEEPKTPGILSKHL